MVLVPAAGVVWRRSSFHRRRAGNREQLTAVHALVDAQLAAILQHADSYPRYVARVVEPGVRTTFVRQAEFLQHGAQLRLSTRHLEEEEENMAG